MRTSEYDSRKITFGQLDQAMDACATWIHELVRPSNPRSLPGQPKPIALYLESDVGLFIHLAALLTMDIPVRSQAKYAAPALKLLAHLETDTPHFSQAKLGKRAAPA